MWSWRGVETKHWIYVTQKTGLPEIFMPNYTGFPWWIFYIVLSTFVFRNLFYTVLSTFVFRTLFYFVLSTFVFRDLFISCCPHLFSETLRKYPPLQTLLRVCTKPYRIPETEVVLEKDIRIFIPVLALHYDPMYYPNPEHFDPERFSEKQKKSRPQYSYLPFGEGPRICIGELQWLLISPSFNSWT